MSRKKDPGGVLDFDSSVLGFSSIFGLRYRTIEFVVQGFGDEAFRLQGFRVKVWEVLVALGSGGRV